MAANNTIAGSPALRVAAAASVLAGLIHFMAVPEHRSEWQAAAVFFTVLGAFQIVWGVAALNEDRRWILRFGVVVNVAVILLWAISRTSGLPFGPDPGQAEDVDVLSVACVLAEVAVIAGTCVAVWNRSSDPSTDESAAGSETVLSG